jgi:hypothetical protein
MYVCWIDDEEAPPITILLLQKKLEKLHHENFHPKGNPILETLDAHTAHAQPSSSLLLGLFSVSY